MAEESKKTKDTGLKSIIDVATIKVKDKKADGFTPVDESLSPDGKLINRELSWLEFNDRVLQMSLDKRTPLLERIAFLAIFNSNLDEFYQKRVGGMKRQLSAGMMLRSADGMSVPEQLAAIRQKVLEALDVQARCYTEVLRPALKQQGVELIRFDDLTKQERKWVRQYFRANVFPVLTPLAFDPGHPFPFISNLSVSVGVILRPRTEESDSDRGREGDDGALGAGHQFARVKVPSMLPRWVKVDVDEGSGGLPLRFIHIRDVIEHNLEDLFPGMIVDQVMSFRVTRNADVERDEEDAEDLLEMIEQELRDRRVARVIRLEVAQPVNEPLTRLLMEELELDESDVYHMPAELDYTDLWEIHGLDFPKLKFKKWTPVAPPALSDAESDIFSVIRSGDVLVHHPYDSFSSSVEKFIRTAARDPKVVAIKQTLYRTSSDSPFIPELMRAAEAGKQVVCLVELKARFDEERNIQVAHQLEDVGVHVVYGMVGLKTHTKTAMVVRQESDGMRVYCHIGTGNYNSKTAQLYTDLGLFTCRREITDDLVELFNFLTGRSAMRDYRELLIAPINMRERFHEMIDREIQHAKAWKERGGDPKDPNRPRIIAKMNSLEDRRIVRRLYKASKAGVKVDLQVRGFCTLRPGVPGLSENITVKSILGRFLEHARIYYFRNNGDEEYYIGSADWMYRNLNNRVECITPVKDPVLAERLRLMLEVMLSDQRQGWLMNPDGSYTQLMPSGDADIGTQQTLMNLAMKEAKPLDDTPAVR